MSWQNRLWVEGYDARLVPRVPCEIARQPGSDRIVFVHHAPGGAKKLLVAPDETTTDPATSRGSGVSLAPGTEQPSDVLALIESSSFDRGWRLMSARFAIAWPAALTVWSTPDEVAWPFELTMPGGPPDEMIYVQGSFANPPPESALVGAGMQIVGRGSSSPTMSWIDLAYTLDGTPWIQRRAFVVSAGTTFLITAQASTARAPTLFALAEEIGASLWARALGEG